MGNNYFTPWQDAVNNLTAASMNPALVDLDKAITYGTKRPIVHTDGDITWSGGTLTWAGTIRILFNTAAGNVVQNTIAASNIALSDNEFCYVTLSETNNAVLTMSKAAITTDAASNFLTLSILVMGYRNTTNDEFYSVWLPFKYSATDASAYVAKTLFDAYSILYADSDNTPAALSVGASQVVGRKSSGGVVAMSMDDLRTLLGNLDGREQAITCADSVTVDWSAGATARMTFDRNAVAFTFSNPVAGKVYRLLLIQGDGSDLATWTTTIKWAGGAAPVLSTAAGAEDIITFVYINGAWYGSATSDFGVPA
jgi:hypothetical protein